MTDTRPAHPPRALTWQVTASGGFESAWITRHGRSLSARGRVFGALPEPYWISYELETGEDYTTRRLTATAETPHATHHLALDRTADGTWTANGAPLDWAADALDCDLGLSPLTNTMPVLRHELHHIPGSGPAERTFLMVWVSVPDLRVHPSRQTYTHLGPAPHGTRVRYASGDFHSDLEFDGDGLVVSYPGLAYRVSPALSPAPTNP
ncbi:putative glycolipid-binding domain-containing protein [Streptomyces apocyni]|uniref:putative glycolipid-binding domain-containing protein n=1 Tax=Streptomyces apocyni TaxID=2654677 RepID=UPI0012EA6648|nr:putative glycolipid-binding domain-containing protein [Streptomyces apocyni]